MYEHAHAHMLTLLPHIVIGFHIVAHLSTKFTPLSKRGHFLGVEVKLLNVQVGVME